MPQWTIPSQKMLQSTFNFLPSNLTSTSAPNLLSLPQLLFTSKPSSRYQYCQCRLKQPQKKRRLLGLCSSYAVGGGFPDEELDMRDRVNGSSRIQEQKGQKIDPAQYEAILKGGEQVTSVLEEMITLLEVTNMDEVSEEVAVQLAAHGVIGKRVDAMESGFMMALDYMIQIAEKDQDDKRKSLLEVIKETVLSHLAKKMPPTFLG